jgi:hypothetical protein
VKITAEVGISYLPFTFTTANTITKQRQPDYTVGISAWLPVHQQYMFISRISFSDRQDVQWQDLCTCPGYEGEKFSHSDLNLDLSIAYAISEKLILGAGPSAIRKFAQWEIRNSLYEDQNAFHYDHRFFFGLHWHASVIFNRIGFRMSYVRILSNLSGFRSPSGQDRIDMTASYLFFNKR